MGKDNRGVEGTCAAPKTERRNRYIKSTAGIAGGWREREGEREKQEGGKKKGKKVGCPFSSYTPYGTTAGIVCLCRILRLNILSLKLTGQFS